MFLKIELSSSLQCHAQDSSFPWRLPWAIGCKNHQGKLHVHVHVQCTCIIYIDMYGLMYRCDGCTYMISLSPSLPPSLHPQSISLSIRQPTCTCTSGLSVLTRSQTTSASEALAELPPKSCDEVVSLSSSEAECPVSAYNEWDLLEVHCTCNINMYTFSRLFSRSQVNLEMHVQCTLNLIRTP